MRKHLKSLCGGNYRGYKGNKEEIEDMFAKCYEDAKEMNCDTSDLDYTYKHKDRLKPNEDGEYVIEYWSKW